MSAICRVLEGRNADLKAKLIWKVLWLAKLIKFIFGLRPRAIVELVAILQVGLPVTRVTFQTLSKFGYNAAV
jgi:hypothetical protein